MKFKKIVVLLAVLTLLCGCGNSTKKDDAKKDDTKLYSGLSARQTYFKVVDAMNDLKYVKRHIDIDSLDDSEKSRVTDTTYYRTDTGYSYISKINFKRSDEIKYGFEFEDTKMMLLSENNVLIVLTASKDADEEDLADTDEEDLDDAVEEEKYFDYKFKNATYENFDSNREDKDGKIILTFKYSSNEIKYKEINGGTDFEEYEETVYYVEQVTINEDGYLDTVESKNYTDDTFTTESTNGKTVKETYSDYNKGSIAAEELTSIEEFVIGLTNQPFDEAMKQIDARVSQYL